MALRFSPYGGKGTSGKGKGIVGKSKGRASATGRSVFVGNLPFSATWQDVKDAFRECGDVVRVEVLTQGGVEGGKSIGSAIVEFKSPVDVERAVEEFHEAMFMDRCIIVREDRGGNRQGAEDGAIDGCSVFVGNLAWNATWQDLKDHLRACGDVARVEVLTEGGIEGGRSKGCATIEFRSAESARRAVEEFHDTDFMGRLLLVREDNKPRPQGGFGVGPRSQAAPPPWREAPASRHIEQPCKVFVGNLAYEVTWQDLKDIFRTCGDVAHVEVMTEGGVEGGRSKGCGIVEFRKRKDAMRAIDQLHDTELMGRLMLVREDQGGRGTGGHSGGGGGARAAMTDEEDAKRCSVFVGNLSFSTNWQQLKDHMREAGEVVHAEVMTERGVPGGRSKGCAIVQYSTLGGARRAVERLHDSVLEGRAILVRPDE